MDASGSAVFEDKDKDHGQFTTGEVEEYKRKVKVPGFRVFRFPSAPR
jgi:hypothetical protein